MSNIISHVTVTSIYYKSFQPTFTNFRSNNMIYPWTKKLWEKNIWKRQTTSNYDLLKEDQDENNNDVSDDEISLISSEQLSPSQFYQLCNNLVDNSDQADTTNEREQMLDESNNIDEPQQQMSSLLQTQTDSSSRPELTNCSHLEPRIPLDKVIIKRNLGILPNDKENTVFKAIKKWNPNFNQEQVTLRNLGRTKTGSILYQIRAKKNCAAIYSGILHIRFNLMDDSSVKKQMLLSNIIVVRDLGLLADSSPETILAAVARLNPGFQQKQVRIRTYGIYKEGLFWCDIIAKSLCSPYYGSIRVRFNLIAGVTLKYKKKALADVIKVRDLGLLADSSPETILTAVARLNPDFDPSQITLHFKFFHRRNGTYSIRVRAKLGVGTSYCGSVYVFFTLEKDASSKNSLHSPSLLIPDENQPGPSGLQTNQFVICDQEEKQLSNEEETNQQDLTNIIPVTNLGFLPNNDRITIFQQLQTLYPSLNINEIDGHWATTDREGNIFWLIYPATNSNYTSVVLIHFQVISSQFQQHVLVNPVQVPPINLPRTLTNYEYHFLNQKIEKISLENNKNLGINLMLKNNPIIEQYNSLPSAEKQKWFNAINNHFQTLSKPKQKIFKEQLKTIGTTALAQGINASKTKITANPSPVTNNHHIDNTSSVLASSSISALGLGGMTKMTGISPTEGLKTTANYLKNMIFSPRSTAAIESEETMELTPLLTTTAPEELTMAETLTAETTATVISEGTIIGTEATVITALAPETLGLSLVIGGLILAGTGLLYWIFNDNSVVKHESNNQYNEIEKYYQFLAHDKLKISISTKEWTIIKIIYQTYYYDFNAFKKKIKTQVLAFHQEDHSGWGGTILSTDIDILIKTIFNHFLTIDHHFGTTQQHGWKIITNTIGSYLQVEPE
ncbi:chitinase [Spiroplasma melliferum]|uniref:chitinase n=1 Tax=Spiroplasma melliferum TaxID=2134 RepID=UPI0018C8D05B|nr:chitinase [Spiroplasma melliferum]